MKARALESLAHIYLRKDRYDINKIAVNIPIYNIQIKEKFLELIIRDQNKGSGID